MQNKVKKEAGENVGNMRLKFKVQPYQTNAGGRAGGAKWKLKLD